ncbi:tetratricopeptide repeat protein [Desulfosarcina sp.]|nr:tetratricopeptide repeat protein [Desulfosarcina sp.]
MIEKHLENYHNYYSNKEFEKALDTVEKILHIDKNNVDALINRGICLFRLQRYEEAVKQFEITISEKIINFKAVICLRMCLSRISRQKNPMPLIEDLFKKFPDNEHLQYFYAEFLYENGEYIEALDKFKTSKAFSSDNPIFCYEYIAKCWYELGDYKKAIENITISINKSFKLNIIKSTFYHQRAKYFFNSKEYDRAYTDAIRALKIYEECPYLNQNECEELYEYIKGYSNIAETH